MQEANAHDGQTTATVAMAAASPDDVRAYFLARCGHDGSDLPYDEPFEAIAGYDDPR